MGDQSPTKTQDNCHGIMGTGIIGPGIIGIPGTGGGNLPGSGHGPKSPGSIGLEYFCHISHSCANADKQIMVAVAASLF